MNITILKIPNIDSRSSKMVVFQHEEGPGEFREKLRKASVETLISKFEGLSKIIPCWDEVFTDMQGDFEKSLCNFQTLDLDLLTNHIPQIISNKSPIM